MILTATFCERVAIRYFKLVLTLLDRIEVCALVYLVVASAKLHRLGLAETLGDEILDTL